MLKLVASPQTIVLFLLSIFDSRVLAKPLDKDGFDFYTYKGFNFYPAYGVGISYNDQFHLRSSIGCILLSFNYAIGGFYNFRLSKKTAIYTGINHYQWNLFTRSAIGNYYTVGYKTSDISIEVGYGTYKVTPGISDFCPDGTYGCNTRSNFYGGMLGIYWWSH